MGEKVQVLFRAYTEYIDIFPQLLKKYNLFSEGDILTMACVNFKSFWSVKGSGILAAKRSYHINKNKSKEG